MRIALVLRVTFSVAVDLLIEGTKLEAQSRERRDVLMVCIEWVAV